MSWIILAFLGLLGEVAFVLFSKRFLDSKVSSKIDPIIFACLLFLLVAIYSFIDSTFVMKENIWEQYINLFDNGYILYVLANLILYTIAPYIYWNALKNISASETSIFYSFVGVYSAILSILVFGKWFGIYGLIGVILLAISQLIVNWDKEKKLTFGKYQYYMLIATFCYAATYLLDSIIIQSNLVTANSYMILSFGVPAILLLIFKYKHISEIKLLLKTNTIFTLLLASAFMFISFLGVYFAYELDGNAAAVASILGLESLLIVLIEGFILRRVENPIQKLISSAIAVIGVILLSI